MACRNKSYQPSFIVFVYGKLKLIRDNICRDSASPTVANQTDVKIAIMEAETITKRPIFWVPNFLHE